MNVNVKNSARRLKFSASLLIHKSSFELWNQNPKTYIYRYNLYRLTESSIYGVLKLTKTVKNNANLKILVHNSNFFDIIGETSICQLKHKTDLHEITFFT